MTVIFGNQTIAQDVIKNFPIPPIQVQASKQQISGNEVLSGKEFHFTQYNVKVLLNSAEVANYNKIDRFAIGAKATVQAYDTKDSNLVSFVKRNFPKNITITFDKPASNLIEYSISWAKSN